ncbi:NTP/NDP exchange transporter [Aliikangiella sp. G2MR2-5]|uniref:NTP/NDP exchange transporter n=1 Tax=Aliikangiella sp. G2MR2-5 TaxID=2788943 RepID=UPI0018ABDB8F|nr:Npt1/Npt2 family nucleotide transporter [Aliikangiella sp. G2MR2-5]
MNHPIEQLLKFSPQERRIVLLSASYFFLLLCAYYILRPVRETMGIARSADDLPLIFLGTMTVTLLLAPVIAALVNRYQRAQFIPFCYHAISLLLLGFFIALTLLPQKMIFAVGIAFYIFLSVVNMLLISLFWGFMSDGISLGESKKLFPSIAIGGTIGAISGSSITQILVELSGQAPLLLISAIILQIAIILMRKTDSAFQDFSIAEQTLQSNTTTEKTVQKDTKSLETLFSKSNKWERQESDSLAARLTSGIRFAISSPYMMAIAGYIFCYGLTSTFLYFQQGQLVAMETGNSHERTQIFSNIDIWSNSLTLLFQLFLSRKLLMHFGIGPILIGLPLLTLSGFAALALAPTLTVLIIFQALRRSLNYGLFKPAREILFTILPTDQKYKAKSFIDTFVYRGGDAIGALSQKGLTSLALGITSLALLVVPIAALWTFLAIFLGREASRAEQNKVEK